MHKASGATLKKNVMRTNLTILSSCILTAMAAAYAPYALGGKTPPPVPNAPMIMRHTEGRVPLGKSQLRSPLRKPARLDAASPSVKLKIGRAHV